VLSSERSAEIDSPSTGECFARARTDLPNFALKLTSEQFANRPPQLSTASSKLTKTAASTCRNCACRAHQRRCRGLSVEQHLASRVSARIRTASWNGKLARQACETLGFDDVPYLCCGKEYWMLLQPDRFAYGSTFTLDNSAHLPQACLRGQSIRPSPMLVYFCAIRQPLRQRQARSIKRSSS